MAIYCDCHRDNTPSKKSKVRYFLFNWLLLGQSVGFWILENVNDYHTWIPLGECGFPCFCTSSCFIRGRATCRLNCSLNKVQDGRRRKTLNLGQLLTDFNSIGWVRTPATLLKCMEKYRVNSSITKEDVDYDFCSSRTTSTQIFA
jgi:hypothetical protein